MGLSVFDFTQLFSKAKKRCSRRALTHDPTVLWRLLSREPARISAQTSYCQKPECMPEICAVCIFISFHAIIICENRTVLEPAKPARKQNLTWNSHSRSLKVTHFGSLRSRRWTACRYVIIMASSLSLQRNSQRKCWRLPLSTTHWRLTPPPQGTPVNIGKNLTSPESRIIGLHFCCW